MLPAPFTPDRHDDHLHMVETNLVGAMNATKVFLDQLRSGGSDLGNLSSVAGRTARPGNAVYRLHEVGHQRLVGVACARSSNPTSRSWSSSPARWPPS